MPCPKPALWAAAILAGACALASSAQAGGYAAAAAAQAKRSPPTVLLERHFLQIAASNLRFEAEAARLADARTNNPAVKDLANAVLARHRTAQPELLHLLHARGMAPPMPTNGHNKLLRQLAKVNGAKFDRLFVDEVVLKSSQADLANYGKVAEQAEDPVLKAWAGRQLPSLRLQQAKAGKALPSASLRGHRAV